MTTAKYSPLFVTKDLIENRYKGADVIFLAGSVMRGEATAFSDIDIVVVYPKIEQAYRESFYHLEWPIEAFVHDPETMAYFFSEVDRPMGSSTLAEMVFDGIVTPEPSTLSDRLKLMASEYIKIGPPALTSAEIEDQRYHLSELLDDLRAPRSRPELIAAATAMYGELADFYFRSRGEFSATGKAILKKLKKSDTAFFRRFTESFEQLFTSGKADGVIELAQEILAPQGGLLFDSYRREVSKAWRSSTGWKK